MTEVLVPKSAESFVRFYLHSRKMVRREREGWFWSMPSAQDSSNHEGRNRRGVAFICGLLVQVLLMGGALFLGALLPVESLAAHEGYALIGHPAFLMLPEKPAVMSPREATGLRIPKLTPPETSILRVRSLVADLEAPGIRHTNPSVVVPESRLPSPPVGLDGPPAKKKIVVHTGLFGGAVETSPTKRSVEKVQTGVFGSSRGFPDRAQSEDPGGAPR